MAPPNQVTAVEQSLKPRGKVVRFADDEGHDLCEIFQIDRSSNYYMGLDLDKNRWRRKPISKPRSLNLYTLPWGAELLNDRISQLNVSLENVVKTQKGIIGMVAVKNIAYCKEVYINYSFNDWKTKKSIQGAFYKQNQPKQVDYFVFVVSDKAACFDGNWNLKFAICYKVAGREYWDNNYGKNYEVICQ
eukprot:gene3461-3957_t